MEDKKCRSNWELEALEGPERYVADRAREGAGVIALKRYRLSVDAFVVIAEVNEHNIVLNTSANAVQFRKQRFDLLLRWLGKRGAVMSEELMEIER